MQKRTDGPTPQEKSRMIEMLEGAEQDSKDPREKDRLARLVASLRGAFVGSFITRPTETDEDNKKDET